MTDNQTEYTEDYPIGGSIEPYDIQRDMEDSFTHETILKHISTLAEKLRGNIFNANHRRLMLEKYGYTEAMDLIVNPNNPYELSRKD